MCAHAQDTKKLKTIIRSTKKPFNLIKLNKCFIYITERETSIYWQNYFLINQYFNCKMTAENAFYIRYLQFP